MSTMPTHPHNPEHLPENTPRLAEGSAPLGRERGIFGTLWDGITYVPRKLLGVAARNPVKTAIAGGLLLYYGTPALMRMIGNAEGGLASVPQNYILRHLRTILPLGNSIPAAPVEENLPGAGYM